MPPGGLARPASYVERSLTLFFDVVYQGRVLLAYDVPGRLYRVSWYGSTGTWYGTRCENKRSTVVQYVGSIESTTYNLHKCTTYGTYQVVTILVSYGTWLVVYPVPYQESTYNDVVWRTSFFMTRHDTTVPVPGDVAQKYYRTTW